MSSVVRPPEPWLVAIILIVSSRAGPRYVFHYPPDPDIEKSFSPSRQGPRGNDSGSDEDSDVSSDEDEVPGPSGSTSSGTGGRQTASGMDDNATVSSAGESQRTPSLSSGRARRRPEVDDSPRLAATSVRGTDDPTDTRAPWESIFGTPCDIWEKFLSPSRTWHKRRFEVGVNDLAFVGWPVFVREDGTWRKRRRRKKRKPKSRREGEQASSDGRPLGDGDECNAGRDSAAASDDEDDMRKQAPAATDKNLIETQRSEGDSMTMFNVVFAMAPPILEYSARLKEMYENIIRKFSRALKHEQDNSDYVWKQSQLILQIKEKAKAEKLPQSLLYEELISQSSLAKAISTVFKRISESGIASVVLESRSFELQIPPLMSTSHLPGPMDTAYPGLWLTTADSLTAASDAANSGLDVPNQVMAKHFALLLLDNEANILRDVEGTELAPALTHYIRCTKPNKSFAQISAASGLPLSTIRELADHLVYWRRARAVPPLHQRHTYIVSPNCDLSKLKVATAAYSQAFPTMPSLPKMLSALSGTPRPYASLIPSKDHKETYFAILAWLLRGGWVTQLRSFARVKVTPDIKISVEQALRREQMEKYLASGRGRSSPSKEVSAALSLSSSSSSSSLTTEGSSQLTPIPGRRESDDQYQLSNSYMDRNYNLSVSSLIQAPHRASPLESRWLDEIMSRFPEPAGEEQPDRDPVDQAMNDSLKKHWPRLVKYFNGHDALEKIPVREGLKRNVVWPLLMRLGLSKSLGIELDPREQVLVTFRHW